MKVDRIDQDEIKRKIRKLKKLEIKIRFGGEREIYPKPGNVGLVWDEFFDLHEVCKKKVKYSIHQLIKMNKDEYKDVISEYFFNIYYRFYRENGIINMQLYDSDVLALIGLSYDADSTDIKKKFRELAKKHHPDTGGDSSSFIELMENYKKLIP